MTDRIVRDPEIMNGAWCIAGTRHTPVAVVLWMLEKFTVPEIKEIHGLTDADIRACLEFSYGDVRVQE